MITLAVPTSSPHQQINQFPAIMECTIHTSMLRCDVCIEDEHQDNASLLLSGKRRPAGLFGSHIMMTRARSAWAGMPHPV